MIRESVETQSPKLVPITLSNQPVQHSSHPNPPPALASSQTQRYQFDLRLCCNSAQQTFVSRQYTAYPFRVSRAFRLDQADPGRIYLYMMNTSPGILAGDQLRIHIDLAKNAQLYLTDQAATKVHSMLDADSLAEVDCAINVDSGASLEFIPEPLLLYAQSSLKQTTQIRLHPTGRLVLSEIIVPGRLARGEYYQFNSYLNRLRVLSPAGKLLFGDALLLQGCRNCLDRFNPLPVLANLIVLLPAPLEPLIAQIDAMASLASASTLLIGYSRLPNSNGLLLRMMADEATTLKTTVQHVLNFVRQLNHQPSLPIIPK